MTNSQTIALITGASRGLGLETAHQLAHKGIRVVVTTRNEQDLQTIRTQFEADSLQADYLALDVTQSEAIRQVTTYLTRTYGKLDILINNAGISLERAPSYQINTSAEVSLSTLQAVYATNVFGVIALTQALLPLLEKSLAGRIVNVSSELGSIGLHADRHSAVYKLKKFAYNSSKTLLNQFTVHLAEWLVGKPCKVNAVSPGWVKTDLGSSYAPLEVAEGAKIIVAAATLPPEGPTGCFFTHELKPIEW